jgi:hypothetical protein
MGPTALLRPEGIFIARKNASSLATFKLTNLGSNGKHNNHYTTKNDYSTSIDGSSVLKYDG